MPPAIRPWLLGLVLWPGVGAPPAVAAAAAPPATPAASRAAIAALDACLRRLDPELDVGLGRIELLCPGLAASLEASGAAALLPGDWKQPRSELSAGGLRALRGLLAGRPLAVALRPAPDPRALQALARASLESRAGEAGRWSRFTRWLRSLLVGREPGADGPGPFARFRELTVPQRVWTVLGYAAVLGLLLFVAGVVRAELRAAGLLGGPRAARAHHAAEEAGAGEGRAPTLDDLPPLERPAWLLQRLGRRLQQLGRLPAPGHLTPREVARLAHLERTDDRAPLLGIATAAERVRFGAQPPGPQELLPAVEAAAGLLQRLEAAAPAAVPAAAGRA